MSGRLYYGMYAGEPMSDIPTGYLAWMLKVEHSQKHLAVAELKLRKLICDMEVEPSRPPSETPVLPHGRPDEECPF